MTHEEKLITSFDFWRRKDWARTFHDFDIRTYRRMLENKGEQFWQKAGERKALKLFHVAAIRVPAYKDFLKKHHVSHEKIRTMKDFAQVPVTDKKNYIFRFPLFTRSVPGVTPEIMYASSGSSGTPTYWFNSGQEAAKASIIHEEIFRDVWRIKKTDRTLVIVCFPMGVWIAGQHTRQAFLESANRGYTLTVLTPGYAKEDIINILSQVAPSYRNIVLAGHPPFIMDVVKDARHRKIRFPRGRFFFLTAGDKIEEGWRDTILGSVNANDPLHSAVNLYGSTDAGVMAYETSVTILIRRLARHHAALRRTIFGSTSYLPSLFQFHPEQVYFETVGGELVLTADTPTPLVRYNIHDRGSIIAFHDMISSLKRLDLVTLVRKFERISAKLPFVTVEGRADVAATFYALHIYPEHVSEGLAHPPASRFVTGTYLSYVKSQKSGKAQEFHIELELVKGLRPTPHIGEAIRGNLMQKLTTLNIEYRKLYEWIGIHALPHIHLHRFGDTVFLNKKVNGFTRSIGKKARMGRS